MARIQHLAIASLDPEKQAEFYKRVFGFKEVKRLDNPRAKGVVLTDGHINISVLQFHQDQIDHGLEFTGLGDKDVALVESYVIEHRARNAR